MSDTLLQQSYIASCKTNSRLEYGFAVIKHWQKTGDKQRILGKKYLQLRFKYDIHTSDDSTVGVGRWSNSFGCQGEHLASAIMHEVPLSASISSKCVNQSQSQGTAAGDVNAVCTYICLYLL